MLCSLVSVLPRTPPPAKAISLLSTDRRFTTPAVQAFATWVEGVIRRHPLNQFPRGK